MRSASGYNEKTEGRPSSRAPGSFPRFFCLFLVPLPSEPGDLSVLLPRPPSRSQLLHLFPLRQHIPCYCFCAPAKEAAGESRLGSAEYFPRPSCRSELTCISVKLSERPPLPSSSRREARDNSAALAVCRCGHPSSVRS